MQMQNKYKHLHYLLCLGAGLRRANSDILADDLPEDMKARLGQLLAAGEGQLGTAASEQTKPSQPRSQGGVDRAD